MEQTKEQSIFMTQYLWQKVFVSPNEKFNPVLLTSKDLEFRVPEFGGYLSLRSVSQLTDGEKIHIGRLFAPEDNYEPSLLMIGRVTAGLFISAKEFKAKANVLSIVAIYQYLISMGICCDQNAIDKGWVVIKND